VVRLPVIAAPLGTRPALRRIAITIAVIFALRPPIAVVAQARPRDIAYGRSPARGFQVCSGERNGSMLARKHHHADRTTTTKKARRARAFMPGVRAPAGASRLSTASNLLFHAGGHIFAELNFGYVPSRHRGFGPPAV
jgi:hypothetical protein